ncbi:MAG: toll/interleukin-1 receptor domain-containing protein [Ruminococcus sp.]|nr:toll/interleukin-1 receptor domain-containing protein [Ruminococcus sp.]
MRNKKKKQIFVSHCSDDKDIMQAFSKYIEPIFERQITFFNTSGNKNTTKPGEVLSESLKRNINKSDAVIALITDSYLRSEVCLAELSACWFANKKIIPIIFNGNEGADIVKKIFGKNIIYIDSLLPEKQCAINLLNAFVRLKIRFKELHDKRLALLLSILFFKNAKQTPAHRSFIGSKYQYESTIRYCNEYGIKQICNIGVPFSKIKEELSKMDEIFILSSTGENIINGLSADFITNHISKGKDITVIVAKSDSDFINDLANIEFPIDPELNKKRLNNSLENVLINLEICYQQSPAKTKGKIYLENFSTLLRQTIILGKKENYVWGLCSLTLPPLKTIDGPPTMVFSGSIKEQNMAKTMYEHVCKIDEYAKQHNEKLDIKDYFDKDPA